MFSGSDVVNYGSGEWGKGKFWIDWDEKPIPFKSVSDAEELYFICFITSEMTIFIIIIDIDQICGFSCQ